jgi:hypothetical protein
MLNAALLSTSTFVVHARFQYLYGCVIGMCGTEIAIAVSPVRLRLCREKVSSQSRRRCLRKKPVQGGPAYPEAFGRPDFVATKILQHTVGVSDIHLLQTE